MKLALFVLAILNFFRKMLVIFFIISHVIFIFIVISMLDNSTLTGSAPGARDFAASCIALAFEDIAGAFTLARLAAASRTNAADVWAATPTSARAPQPKQHKRRVTF